MVGLGSKGAGSFLLFTLKFREVILSHPVVSDDYHVG